MSLFVVPTLLAGRTLPMPLWAVQLVSGAQGAALLAVAAVVGVALGSKVGLVAPALSALAETGSPGVTFRPQLVPGLLGGLASGVVLWLLTRYSPESLANLQAQFAIPPSVRFLYGGVTEELLIRWGLMTLIVWFLWRILEGGVGTPSDTVMWLAICIGAIMFGLGHLPTVSAMIGHLSAQVAVYVICANAAFGLVAGWLYWRYGLESAIIAHAMAHVVLLVGSR